LEKMVRPKFPTIVQFQVFHGTLQLSSWSSNDCASR
jgi:hypothetical protein